MQIKKQLQAEIEGLLTLHHASPCAVLSADQLSGGSISSCFRVKTNHGFYFLKTNEEKNFNKNFESEAKGLNILKSKSRFDIPEVIGIGEIQGTCFLLLTFLQKDKESLTYWEQTAHLLTELHKNSNKQYGLDHDNFIGSLKQQNGWFDDFEDYFFSSRIEPMVKMAVDKSYLDKYALPYITRLHRSFGQIIPHEKPGLIHGDLWSGNIFPSINGPAIFDPSISYGHREMDIAMTKLFGGFDEQFYKQYHHFYPLAPGWKDRIAIWNLYPLLVHVNLFGNAYVKDVMNILRRF